MRNCKDKALATTGGLRTDVPSRVARPDLTVSSETSRRNPLNGRGSFL
jgi:hypothetical protein